MADQLAPDPAPDPVPDPGPRAAEISLDHLCPAEAGKLAAITFKGQAIHYSELEQSVASLAAHLSTYFEPGELVGLWLPNCPEMLQLCLAGWRNQMVAMPLNAEVTRPELISICQQAGLRTLVTSPALAATLSAAELRASGIQGLLVCDAQAGTLLPQVIAGLEALRHRPLLLAEQAALVLHTSGSSGSPKAVVISPSALQHIIQGRIDSASIDNTSRALMASCLSHSVGLYQSLAYLRQGAHFELLESYEPEQLIESLNRMQPTHLIMVVSAFQKLLSHPDVSAQSFSKLRFASVGADRVPAELQKRFHRLTGQVLVVSYGMTELSWILLNEIQDLEHSTALGRPAPGVEVRLLDSSGEKVAEGELGEIVARSPKLMSGYLTRNGIVRSGLRSGWIYSGDLARRDSNGVYWFGGRIKDLIVVSSGDVVSPAEIEQAALLLDGVSDCTAVGVEVVEADTGSYVTEPWLVITSAAPDMQPGAVLEWLRLQLSPHKVPRRVVFQDSLPKNITGKVSRQQLAAYLQALPA